MIVHEVNLRPLGPFRKPPRAPGIFGHLAWAKRYRDGEEALTTWLEAFKANPPLKISSAFPTGYLPRPELPPVAVADTSLRKHLKKVRYLPTPLFEKVAVEGEAALIKHLEEQSRSTHEEKWMTESRTRVTIDRQTGGALEGALFTDEVQWFSPEEPGTLSIYLQGADTCIQEAIELLHMVGRTGYGGGGSIGLGCFEITSQHETTLPEVHDGNYAVTLSPVLPREGMSGWWRVEPYWGRLGGHYASQAKPFKRPYLHILEGSTLDPDTPGGMLETTPDPPPEEGVQVWDYLYAFQIPVRVAA